MAAELHITQTDIDDLATKLDEFATVLSDDQREVLYAIMQFASQALRQATEPVGGGGSETPGGQPGEAATAPRLSDGFRGVFAHGTGSAFAVAPDNVAGGAGGGGSIQSDIDNA